MDEDGETPGLGDWLGFALFLPLVFGLAFQTPLVMLVLDRLGIVGADVFRRNRKLAIFLLALAVAILTVTPDVVGMLSLAVPLRVVRVLAFRPDGKLLAAAGGGPEVVLVEPDTGRVRATLRHAPPQKEVPKETVQALAFSPDGRHLVSAGRDRLLRLWDVETGELMKEMRGHTNEVFAVLFHPDGKRIASGGRDRAVRLWDAERGEEQVRLPGHTDYIFSLAFSPDGNTLVSGSGDHTVRLWEKVPLTRRLEARRTLARLRPEAERLVERLLREEGTAAQVADRLRTEPELSEPLRHAARLALLGRGAVPPR